MTKFDSSRTGGGVKGWLPRIVGTLILGGQSWAHLNGRGSDLYLVGAGLFLLAGREGREFLSLLVGRASGSGSGPGSPPSDSR